jgi:hypothetical protein
MLAHYYIARLREGDACEVTITNFNFRFFS